MSELRRRWSRIVRPSPPLGSHQKTGHEPGRRRLVFVVCGADIPVRQKLASNGLSKGSSVPRSLRLLQGQFRRTEPVLSDAEGRSTQTYLNFVTVISN